MERSIAKLKEKVPDHYRRSLGQVRYRIQKALQDRWFHFWNRTPRRLIIVVGTSYRVGSTWLYNMLRDVAHCKYGGKRVPVEFLRLGTLLLEPGVYAYLRQLRGQLIFKSHSFPPSSESLASSATFVSIYRDPRDVLVSAGFFFAFLEPERGGWGPAARQFSIQERIQMLITGQSDLDVLAKLEEWFRTPFAYKTRYEDLKNQPVEELWKVAEYIGVSTTKKAIEEIVLKHAFEAGANKKLRDTREVHRKRKGIVGDWRNHFDQACIDAFKTQRDGRWNQLLVEMGYEDSLDWV